MRFYTSDFNQKLSRELKIKIKINHEIVPNKEIITWLVALISTAYEHVLGLNIRHWHFMFMMGESIILPLLVSISKSSTGDETASTSISVIVTECWHKWESEAGVCTDWPHSECNREKIDVKGQSETRRTLCRVKMMIVMTLMTAQKTQRGNFMQKIKGSRKSKSQIWNFCSL